MKKKLAALAMTTVMVLSLAGCGKKIEGTYVAEVDMTDALVEKVKDNLDSLEIGNDFDWKGSVSLTLELELEDGEYTFKTDKKKLENDCKDFFCDNLEALFEYAYKEEYGASASLDDWLESEGYSSIWEALGYDSAEDYYDSEFEEGSIANTAQKESGDYTVKNDKIILDDFDGDEQVLKFEDGELTGKFDFSNFNMDDNLKVTFEREDD